LPKTTRTIKKSKIDKFEKTQKNPCLLNIAMALLSRQLNFVGDFRN